LAGVSRQWLNEFENGKAAGDVSSIMRLMNALDLRVSIDAPADEPTGDRAAGTDLDNLLDAHRHR